MAGHSHAKNVAHRKAVQSAKRSQAYGKLIREVTVSAKQGMPDPAHNPRLRAAVKAALQANMPRDTVERAIKRVAAGTDTENYDEVRYEGYGPGGVAVIVEALTDNRNRTASDLRSAFSKHGGALGETNSVSFQFTREGVVRYPLSVGDADRVLEAAIEAGADDVETDEDGHAVRTAVEDLFAVRDALEVSLGPAESAKLEWRANATIPVGEEAGRGLLRLLDVLDEHDDVQNVYANYDMDEAVIERLTA